MHHAGPYDGIIAAMEATSQKLDQSTADALRLAFCGALQQAKPPKPNLSFHQRRALWELGKDESIVILHADKGRSTVILDREDYTRKWKHSWKMTSTVSSTKIPPWRVKRE